MTNIVRAILIFGSVLVAQCGSMASRAAEADASRVVVVGRGATSSERTAAQEVSRYLGKMTGHPWPILEEERIGVRRAAIWVGPTSVAAHAGLATERLRSEEWALRSAPQGMIVTGGRPRGTLYAAWHLLDRLGVRWWTPWEETVPRVPRPNLTGINARGIPAFRYRDVYMVEGAGAAPWCARNRLNRNGDSPIPAEYGGAMGYGPPYHVHTFYAYVPPKEFFATHPEYYAEVGGKRTSDNAQLCTTNAELRGVMLERLRYFIRTSRDDAAREGSPPPAVYDVSQNDCGGFCECAQCKSAAEREGGYAGPYIDLVNYLADGIRAEFPDVAIDTLAYFQTQKPPRNVRAHDNVIIRLCDTDSNFALPITNPANKAFRAHILAWAKFAKHLRIWDYAVTYGPHSVLPFASAQTYPIDFRFYRAHNVEGVFTEHEYGLSGDMRDMKLWMIARYLENPDLNYQSTLRDFTDGYYGAGGYAIRVYLRDLQAAQEKAKSFVGMSSGPISFAHLTPTFVAHAQALFDRAEAAVAAKPELVRRVRIARLSLDRATLVLGKRLQQQANGGKLPWDRYTVARRALAIWLSEIDRRVDPGRREAERNAAKREIGTLAAIKLNTVLPQQFRGLPVGAVQDYTADEFRNWNDEAKVSPDSETDTGAAARLQLPDDQLAKYKLPMPWGAYDTLVKTPGVSASIQASDVPGPGYHWYRLPTVKVGSAYYVWFFWSWVIQCDLLPGSGAQYDIHARIKFEGPAFPYGRADQQNAISVERVITVRKR